MSRKSGTRPVSDEGAAVLEEAAAEASEREPCVGLPVQYHTPTEVLPGILQRRSVLDPDLWDVKVFLAGASVPVLRAAVKRSDTPRPGYWTFLPV